jgi:hypothetical protein
MIINPNMFKNVNPFWDILNVFVPFENDLRCFRLLLCSIIIFQIRGFVVGIYLLNLELLLGIVYPGSLVPVLYH